MNNEMIRLETNQEKYELLHKALDKARSNAKFIKTDRKALACLLIDHGVMVSELESMNIKIKQ